MARGSYKVILPAVGKNLREATRAAFIATVTEAGNRIVDRTPVDTGLLRGNWQLGKNTAEADVLDRKDPDGSAAKSSIASGAVNLELGDTAVIINAAPYAGFIEYGTSKIPPFAMVGLTQQEVGGIFQKEIVRAMDE